MKHKFKIVLKYFDYSNAHREKIGRVCTPLFAGTRYSRFGYTRRYQDGRSFGIYSDPTYFASLLEDGIRLPLYSDRSVSLPSGVYCLDDFGVCASSDGSELCVLMRHEVCDEIFHFVADVRSEELRAFYPFDLANIYHFCWYFLSHSRSLIRDCRSPKAHVRCTKLAPSGKLRSSDQDFARSAPISRVRMPLGRSADSEVYLGRQEFRLLDRLHPGVSTRLAAEQIDITLRTAETYLDNIKNKLRVSERSEIFELLRKTPIPLPLVE